MEEKDQSSTALSTTTAATATATSSTVDDDDDGERCPPQSRLADIWDNHLKQYRRIDNLEKRIDEHAARLRRRITNILETTPTHRLSHMRLFVSHHTTSPAATARLLAATTKATSNDTNQQEGEEEEKGGEEKTTTASATADPLAKASATEASPKSNNHNDNNTNNNNDDSRKWTLVVEGKLLIGHLDHESARAFDERLKQEFRDRHKVSADHSSMPLATSKSTSSTMPTEEEDPIDPIQFTHFFDKLVVQFQSVYQPAVPVQAAASGSAVQTPKAATTKGNSSSSKKKSRSAKRQKTAAQEAKEAAAPADVKPEHIDPRLLTYSDPTEYVWNKTVTTLTSPNNPGDSNNKTPSKAGGVTTTQTTSDAHAFYVHYDASPPPSDSMKHCGVIATAQLYPTRGPEQRYKPSKEFAKAFFPKHVDAAPPPVLPTVAIAEAKKAQDEQDAAANDGTNTPAKSNKRKGPPAASSNSTPAYQTAPNALDNEIHVPISLTMKEIITSLFTYIQDNKLTREDDPTLIQNDKTLQSLFDCETMHFYELQTLLTQQKLIMLLPKPAPITFKYVIMDSPSEEEEDDNNNDDDGVAAPMTVDLHNDVYVPNLFPNRARECLRRIKRRELEYTSNRTKARYLIMASRAKDESVVKTKIEEAICGGKSIMGEWPVLACLAKAAPPHSEARTTNMLDAKIAYLLQQVEQSQNAAQQAWDLVDSLSQLNAETTRANLKEEEEQDEKEAKAKREEGGEDKPPGQEGQAEAMEIDSPTPVTTGGAKNGNAEEETDI